MLQVEPSGQCDRWPNSHQK